MVRYWNLFNSRGGIAGEARDYGDRVMVYNNRGGHVGEARRCGSTWLFYDCNGRALGEARGTGPNGHNPPPFPRTFLSDDDGGW
jgi:hypothetical protein